jgi:hypothetical protein
MSGQSASRDISVIEQRFASAQKPPFASPNLDVGYGVVNDWPLLGIKARNATIDCQSVYRRNKQAILASQVEQGRLRVQKRPHHSQSALMSIARYKHQEADKIHRILGIVLMVV